jgi:outer membrane protein OmpA-like peptidoglycan-associated protein
MKQTTRLLRLLVCAILFSLPLHAQAQESLSIDGLRSSINAFKNSKDHHFAPATIQRSEAYLGAAMLATDQQKTDEATSALKRASETLEEARGTARSFQQQHQKLLALRPDSIAAVEAHAAASQTENQLTFQHLTGNAETALNTAIQAMESGQLNQSRQHAAEAKALYIQALEKVIPWIAEEAAAAVAKAASGGAKKYAPVTYQAAKSRAAELHSFVLSKAGNIPSQPIEALHLAQKARALAQQIKQWRKKVGSHEDMVLKEKAFRQQLAKSLGLAVHENALLADVSSRDMQQAIAALKKELADERKARIEDSARLKKYYGADLQIRLSALQEELQTAKNVQLVEMKDAFRAKMKRTEEDYRSTLEKETFETKRQKAVHALFQKKEASILANLDGSLIIRLSNLKFASNKSKIDSKNFDLLGRLKEALDIYSDRNARIEGHTDSIGEVKPNQKLSLKRAEAVRDFLIAAGIDGGRLKALGYGEVRPIASNEFEQGRAMNRRIDIAIDAAK